MSNPETLEPLVGVLKALADPNRLQIAGLLIERARCGQDLAQALGLSAPTVSHHLRVLRDAGLLREERQTPYTFYAFDHAALRKALSTLVDKRKVQEFAEGAGLSKDTRKVLHAFFDGPRLVAIPVQRRKKEIVFEEILRRLPRRREYEERELSRFIEAIHEDYATIRREFIMCKYMTRDAGMYRLTDRGRTALDAR